jgi:hypothetical protein
MADETVICDICGAELKNRRALNMHRWNRHRDELPKGETTTEKKQPRPPARRRSDRRDLTSGLQANFAMLGLVLGVRSEWKGQVTVEMAPTLAKTWNQAAAEGPEWVYRAVEMVASGGPLVTAGLVTVGWVAALSSERSERAAAIYDSLRPMTGGPPRPGTPRTKPEPQPSATPFIDLDQMRKAAEDIPEDVRANLAETLAKAFAAGPSPETPPWSPIPET